MKPIDIIILLVIIIVVGLIVYFNIYKKKGNSCKGCPYCKSCDKARKKNN